MRGKGWEGREKKSRKYNRGRETVDGKEGLRVTNERLCGMDRVNIMTQGGKTLPRQKHYGVTLPSKEQHGDAQEKDENCVTEKNHKTKNESSII